jgi:23S rRNA (adenine1618-N6)-methyltransferase
MLNKINYKIEFIVKENQSNFVVKTKFSFLVIQMDASALFDGLINRANHYDFLMCNPPFFSDTFESQGLTHTRKSDRPVANSINTAADVESIYDQGGEVEFVKRMINESRRYATNVR